MVGLRRRPPRVGIPSVITSVTVGPAGAEIGPVEIDGCKVSLTVPPGTFKTQVQISLTAPSVTGVGNGGHPGYRAVCGAGVLVTVNGKPYTGAFGHALTLNISGFEIRPGDRVAVWNGKNFVFVGATVAGYAVQVRITGSTEDVAVLAPGGGGGGGGQSARGGVVAAFRSSHGSRGMVLTSLFFTPAGLSPAGIGVLAPEWLTAISR